MHLGYWEQDAERPPEPSAIEERRARMLSISTMQANAIEV